MYLSLIETERVFGFKPRLAFEIYQREASSNHFWLLQEPGETFFWMRQILYKERDISVEITGYLGRTVPETRVANQPNLQDLWKKWYSQAVQSRAGILCQPVVYPC